MSCGGNENGDKSGSGNGKREYTVQDRICNRINKSYPIGV